MPNRRSADKKMVGVYLCTADRDALAEVAAARMQTKTDCIASLVREEQMRINAQASDAIPSPASASARRK